MVQGGSKIEADFWHQRWSAHEIGFHEKAFNRFLERFWASLDLPDESTVLVPLCGKSRDLVWLAQRGHRVLGVELSETAVREFFEELQLTPHIRQRGLFKHFAADNIELWVGDFFNLKAADLAAVAGVYDRAALVALPPAMRSDYVRLLAEILPASTQTLLITFEYQPGDGEGPPFSINEQDVCQLFDATCDIQTLDSQPVELRGAKATEHAFHLRYGSKGGQ